MCVCVCGGGRRGHEARDERDHKWAGSCCLARPASGAPPLPASRSDKARAKALAGPGAEPHNRIRKALLAEARGRGLGGAGACQRTCV